MQLSSIPITFKDITAIERDFDLKSSIKKDMAKHIFQSYKESSFIWRFNLNGVVCFNLIFCKKNSFHDMI